MPTVYHRDKELNMSLRAERSNLPFNEESLIPRLIRLNGDCFVGLRPPRNDILDSPIIPSAAFPLHQPKADEFTAQRRCIFVVTCQDFINLLFTIAFSNVECLDYITQNRFQFLALRGECFQTAIAARIIFDHFLVVGIRVHFRGNVGKFSLREHCSGFLLQHGLIELIDIRRMVLTSFSV